MEILCLAFHLQANKWSFYMFGSRSVLTCQLEKTSVFLFWHDLLEKLYWITFHGWLHLFSAKSLRAHGERNSGGWNHTNITPFFHICLKNHSKKVRIKLKKLLQLTCYKVSGISLLGQYIKPSGVMLLGLIVCLKKIFLQPQNMAAILFCVCVRDMFLWIWVNRKSNGGSGFLKGWLGAGKQPSVT